jgi:hypothetical protein
MSSSGRVEREKKDERALWLGLAIVPSLIAAAAPVVVRAQEKAEADVFAEFTQADVVTHPFPLPN